MKRDRRGTHKRNNEARSRNHCWYGEALSFCEREREREREIFCGLALRLRHIIQSYYKRNRQFDAT
jgi:hypothetical protein